MSQVITNAFEQYWQSSLAAEQPVVLDEFILADIPNLDITAPIDPDTVLPPESQIVHRQNVDQRGRINNNAVAYTIVMDTTVGNFSFNAMYLRNKQNGVIGMIVYKGRETKLKTDQTTGQTGNSLVKSMLMGYDQAAEATLTNVDAGTWQIDYAARLRGMDEDIRQLQADLYGHHTFVGDGFKVVETDGAFQVTPGVAIVGGLRVELKAPEVIHPGTKPIGVWVDVHRAGSLLSEHQNHFNIITSVADLTDHVDSNGYQHYVAKLATVRADGTIEDGRGVSGSTSGIPDTFVLWKRSMAEAGYDLIGQFGTELIIETAEQVVLSKDGKEVYAWTGVLPKHVRVEDAGMEKEWVGLSGETLRKELKVFAGVIDKQEKWGGVPARVDCELDIQAKAIADRTEYLKARAELCYLSVDAMLKDKFLCVGCMVKTKRFALAIDSEWIITDSPSGFSLELDNGLFAELLSSDGDIRHYGAAPYPFDCYYALMSAIGHVGGYHAPKGIWKCIGSLEVSKGFWCSGVGCLPGIGSDIAAELQVGRDLHEYRDDGSYPGGGVNIKKILFTNDIAEDYYSFPDPDMVILTKNRAFWGVESQPYVDTSTWVDRKEGGSNCPHLNVVDVCFRNFLVGADAHTWMSKFDGVYGRYCGVTLRLYGTSTEVLRCWPQYPLVAGYQLRLEYSKMDSCSLGEHSVNGYTSKVVGCELHGGNMEISNAGMELACESQFRIFNGKYLISNPWSSLKDGFKPRYIYDIVSYPDLSLDSFFDYRYYSRALMRTRRRDNVDGIKMLTPIFPWYQSSVNSQFFVWERVVDDGRDAFIGIFGKTVGKVNGVQLLPFSRDNYTINASQNIDSAKAEYVARFDSVLDGSAQYQHRVVVDGSGLKKGDVISGVCEIIPMVGLDADGVAVKYSDGVHSVSVKWSAIKGDVGFVTSLGKPNENVTASVSVSGDAGKETVIFGVMVGDSAMSATQKPFSKCRYIDEVRTVSPGNTDKDYIVKIARS